jgi:hypothetical protein
MEWYDVGMTHSLPYNSLMVDQSARTLESGNMNKKLRYHTFTFHPDRRFGIKPHFFDANRQAFEGPLVYIGQISGGNVKILA